VAPSIVLPDITVVGAGLLATRQLGSEADDVLRAARVVFCSTTNTGIAEYARGLNTTAIPIRFADYPPLPATLRVSRAG
jgi:precorrin-6B methylase 1